mmetsp:Transcript_21090/g.33057  ORF Transcript_21090/g.33057 Transcript_21090/m.33057 type:complete len:229 (+) Transcript_21090:351-1037(+)|eukprot:CAMPEP_0184321928 /NCGR_PEP_ID=MMETSP1049-20130417/121892_1 /TAXON_ID=77928 /ORGANISM="Proteomonas sulcata, Strain CCMP704" /LENGTH=228 /DNA_ID=CAMNT_0026642907 /DNA_START=261 /DNA_END=947 /DNA_ORIENTATION=+
MLVDDLRWREERGVQRLRNLISLDAIEELRTKEGLLETWNEMLPHGMLGWDRKGRPVMYRKIASVFNASKLEKVGFGSDVIIRYNTWMLERLVYLSGDTGQFVNIVDLGDLRWGHTTPSTMKFGKAMASVLKEHFPERMAKTFLINAPTFFAAVWAIVSTWLDQRIQDKVTIVHNETKWRTALQELFDEDMLPTHLGGKVELSFRDGNSLDPKPAGADSEEDNAVSAN